ncbi:hypothetical protein OSB04_025369 [Centaurea solstitialis]|uniref:Chalcone-flavonone isomerase family protein n=1 Tax=Centaurea solstitialis TaxID=347529 RepID=A0AA38W1N0_9ASTR|nr:hypothetical protein OSB04_025369 [Centaurea solstitialis]
MVPYYLPSLPSTYHSHHNGRSVAVLASIQVESIIFPPSIKPPGATTSLFLGGAENLYYKSMRCRIQAWKRHADVDVGIAFESCFYRAQGVRGLEIEGKFVKFTGIGVYLEDKAISSLADKWKGKTAAELMESVQFFRDIVTAQGTYTDADNTTIEKLLHVFKDENFLPGSSIFLTTSPSGSLTINFSKDGVIPKEAATIVLENEKLAQAFIESVIGEHGVSPATKQSLASRLSDFMKQFDEKATANVESKLV